MRETIIIQLADDVHTFERRIKQRLSILLTPSIMWQNKRLSRYEGCPYRILHYSEFNNKYQHELFIKIMGVRILSPEERPPEAAYWKWDSLLKIHVETTGERVIVEATCYEPTIEPLLSKLLDEIRNLGQEILETK